MKHRSVFATFAALLALAALAYGYRQSQQPTAPTPAAGSGQPAAPAIGSGGRPPAPVEVAEAKTQILTDGISAIGSLVAAETANVSTDSSGRIVAVLAQNSAAVKKGDELFRLDGALLAAELTDAEARLALAEANFSRNQVLVRSKSVAQSTVDQAHAELELARSALGLAQERQRRLVIRAPFDGQLGFRQVSEGAYVTPGTGLVRIDQISTLQVTLSIPERFFNAVSTGQEVEITADAVPGRTFRARIAAINPVVDVNGRALQILASLDNADLALRPGMLVKAKVVGSSRQAIMVSESALVPQGKDQVLFVVKENKAERRTVLLGQRRDGMVEVAEGLNDGDVVVIAGATRLSPGAPVKLSVKSNSPEMLKSQ